MVRYAEGRVMEYREAEVMDIDENLFRQGIYDARLYGYLKVPNEKKFVQNLKSGRGCSEDASIQSMCICQPAHRTGAGISLHCGNRIHHGPADELYGKPNTLLGVDLLPGPGHRLRLHGAGYPGSA